jgi:hypothetical protein
MGQRTGQHVTALRAERPPVSPRIRLGIVAWQFSFALVLVECVTQASTDPTSSRRATCVGLPQPARSPSAGEAATIKVKSVDKAGTRPRFLPTPAPWGSEHR